MDRQRSRTPEQTGRRSETAPIPMAPDIPEPAETPSSSSRYTVDCCLVGRAVATGLRLPKHRPKWLVHVLFRDSIQFCWPARLLTLGGQGAARVTGSMGLSGT